MVHAPGRVGQWCSGTVLSSHAEVLGSNPDVGWHFSSDKNERYSHNLYLCVYICIIYFTVSHIFILELAGEVIQHV